MTSKEKKIVAISMLISVFLGGAVLVVLAIKNKSKLRTNKLKDLAKSDLSYWNGIKETSLAGATKLAEYWKSLGFNYSVDQLRSPEFQSNNYWSAVYISNLMKRWGAGEGFKYSPSHSTYILAGKKALENKDKKAIFYSFPPEKINVSVGDIIAKTRKAGINYDNLYAGFPTHTDVIYDIEKTDDGYTAFGIGGNVSNTVGVSKIHLDKQMNLTDPSKYLAVMKNQKT